MRKCMSKSCYPAHSKGLLNVSKYFIIIVIIIVIISQTLLPFPGMVQVLDFNYKMDTSDSIKPSSFDLC